MHKKPFAPVNSAVNRLGFSALGEGTIHVTDSRIWLDGEVAPGPDYRLYLTKMQVSSKQEFLDIKDDALQIAPIKAFRNFSVSVPAVCGHR